MELDDVVNGSDAIVPAQDAKDVPSLVSGEDFAKRLLDEQYGPGDYDRGPATEFNQIQKWGDRSFKDPSGPPMFFDNEL